MDKFLSQAFTTPVEDYDLGQGPEIDYPFEEQGSNARRIRRRYKVLRSAYTEKPSVQDDIKDPVFTAAYYVGEGSLQPIGVAGLSVFWRTFIEVPSGTLMDYSTMSFSVPGVAGFVTDDEGEERFERYGSKEPDTRQLQLRTSYEYAWTNDPEADFSDLEPLKIITWPGTSRDPLNPPQRVDFVWGGLVKNGVIYEATDPDTLEFLEDWFRVSDDYFERYEGSIYRRVIQEARIMVNE